jgi:hypothetical protein
MFRTLKSPKSKITRYKRPARSRYRVNILESISILLISITSLITLRIKLNHALARLYSSFNS